MIEDKGIGDTIERITNAIGISGMIESISKNCGCKKRKEKLNQLFPYSNNLKTNKLIKK